MAHHIVHQDLAYADKEAKDRLKFLNSVRYWANKDPYLVLRACQHHGVFEKCRQETVYGLLNDQTVV